MLCWTSYKLLETLKYWSVSSHFLTGKLVNVWQHRTTDIPNLKCLVCSIFSSLSSISLLVCYLFVIIILSFIQGFFSRVPREIVIKKICIVDIVICMQRFPYLRPENYFKGSSREQKMRKAVLYCYLSISLLLPAYYCLAVC